MRGKALNENAYFYGLRAIARARTMENLNNRVLVDGGAVELNGTILSSIDEEAIAYAETEWPKFYGESTHFGFSKPWSYIWYTPTCNHPISTWQFGRNLMITRFYKVWLWVRRQKEKNICLLTG